MGLQRYQDGVCRSQEAQGQERPDHSPGGSRECLVFVTLSLCHMKSLPVSLQSLRSHIVVPNSVMP